MIFRRRKKKSKADTRPSARGAAPERGVAPAAPRRRGSGAGAFTLVEVLLCLAIVMVILSVAVISIDGLREGRVLPDAADRLASALRMARASAATQGRRLRLTMLQPETGVDQPLGQFEIENDPLGAPGTFTPYETHWADVLQRTDVEFVTCRLIDESEASVMQKARGEDDDSLPPITFRPDGSCDSAEIHIRQAGVEEGPVAIVTLDGMNARATTDILSAEDYAEREEGTE